MSTITGLAAGSVIAAFMASAGFVSAQPKSTPAETLAKTTAKKLKVVSIKLSAFPTATPAEIQQFEKLLSTQGGIVSTAFFDGDASRRIGLAAGIQNMPDDWPGVSDFREWFPIATNGGTKETVCGRVTAYWGTGSSTDNADWQDSPKGAVKDWISDAFHEAVGDFDFDIDIKPAPEFSHLLTVPQNTVHGLPAGVTKHKDYIHAEIMLPPRVNPAAFDFHNGLLQRLEDTPTRVCVYGPWIVDDNKTHLPGGVARKLGSALGFTGSHVEIHPAEQIWTGDLQAATLLATADYSKRFNALRHENRPNGRLMFYPQNALVQPWARAPLQVKFGIAFKIKPNEAPITLNVVTTAAHNAAPDPTGSLITELSAQNPLATKSAPPRKLVRVAEFPGNHFGDAVHASFERVRQRPDGTIQGWIVLKSKVGRADNLEGGHLALATSVGPLQDLVVNVLAIERLKPNRVSIPANGGTRIVPANTSQAYSDELAKVSGRFGNATASVTVEVPVGQQRSTQLRLAAPFPPAGAQEFAAHVTVTDQDEQALGSVTLPARLAQAGQILSVEVPMWYSRRALRAKMQVEPGTGPAGVPITGESVVRFKLTYRVELPTAVIVQPSSQSK